MDRLVDLYNKNLKDLLAKFVGDRKKVTLILAGTVIIIYSANKYRKWLKHKRFFKDQNIPGPMPVPVFGNFLDVISKGLLGHDFELMQKYGKVCGAFEGGTPVLMTSDPEFIKTVMIKDFNYFVNRRVFELLAVEPADKFLTVLKDEEWKNVRTIVSSVFTSGKLKLMSKCITDVANNLDAYLNELVDKDGILDTRTYFGSFTVDVISSCFFGIQTDSIKDPNNEYLQQIQKVFSTTVRNPKILMLFFAPNLSNFMARHRLMEIYPREPMNFIKKLTYKVIEMRQSKQERREDFIQHILEHAENPESLTEEESTFTWTNKSSQNNGSTPKRTLTKNELLSTAILFLAAGYETTSIVLCFIAYNLAMHPEYQQRLCEEIDHVLEKHGGKVTYDAVHEMPYLDMIIDETLRLYPPAFRVDRVASADYEYKGIKMKKGQVWTASIYSLHHDASIYPDPFKFDPERFNEENKKKRDNGAFIPFGNGPRICVGMRFALVEIKLLMATILAKYQFAKCDKTPETVDLDCSGQTRPSKPIFVKVVRR